MYSWVNLQPSQYEKKDLARTYVAVGPGEVGVLGTYAISTHRVRFEACHLSLPSGRVPGD